jgi:hypothetical protein
MAVATAKFWGILPHVIWRYPFRYYKELRDFYIRQESVRVAVRGSSSPRSDEFDWEQESLRGEAI